MILRYALIAVLLAALVPTLALAVVHAWCPPLAAPVIWIGALLAFFLFEVQRYKPVPASSGPWYATNEKFVDPQSGVATQVFVNPKTGERDYRPMA